MFKPFNIVRAYLPATSTALYTHNASAYGTLEIKTIAFTNTAGYPVHVYVYLKDYPLIYNWKIKAYGNESYNGWEVFHSTGDTIKAYCQEGANIVSCSINGGYSV